MTSRTQVADYIANQIHDGKKSSTLITEVAAWLRAHGKTRQVQYLVNDVATALTKFGYYCVSITTARELNNEAKKNVENSIIAMTGAKKLECSYAINPALIGGIVISTPDATLDASIQKQLAKIIEGVN
jgi:F0F1-type ATP synthase delta subunit